MTAYIVKYCVQENGAYIVGVLSAHMRVRTAQHEVAEISRDLLAKGFEQQSDSSVFVTKSHTVTLYIETLAIID